MFRPWLLPGGRVVLRQVFTNFTTFTNWCYNEDHEARYCDHPR